MNFIWFCLLVFSFKSYCIPSGRGVCFTSSVKHSLRQVDWQFIRNVNARERLRLLNEFSSESIAVGDTKTFWSWNLSVMPPLWIQIPATCRAVGDSCYIFIANDQWNVNMTQENTDTVLANFEHHTLTDPTKGIVQLDVEHFGEIPDEIDGDRHVYIFYSALGSYNGTAFDGYFSAFNQMTEAQAQAHGGHSNEIEMFYMTCWPLPPSTPQRLSVLAHELEHMIHWNMDEDEDVWVDEGCAEFAMWLYGLPDEISDFPSHPDDNLLQWDQQWRDYIQTYLFMMYFFEHYGGTQTIKNMVADTLNSVEGIENALILSGYPETDFNELFMDWTVANFLDDTVYFGGKYGYFLLELPSFFRTVHVSYPVSEPGKTVNPWGTDYLLFSGGNELSFSFDGNDNSLFGIGTVCLSNSTDTVFFPGLDTMNCLNLDFDGFGTQYNQVLITVSRLCSLGSDQYSYSANVLTTIEENPSSPVIFSVSPFFDHFSSRLSLDCDFGAPGSFTMKIFDCAGRIFESREFFIVGSGRINIQMNLSGISSGNYFIVCDFSEKTVLSKFSVFKI